MRASRSTTSVCPLTRRLARPCAGRLATLTRMDFAPLAAMATLVIAIVNLIQYAKARDVNGAVTTFAVWVAGVVVALLVRETDFASGIDVTDTLTLGALNTWSTIFLGLTVGTIGQFAVQIKRAIDSSDSAAKPDLVGGG